MDHQTKNPQILHDEEIFSRNVPGIHAALKDRKIGIAGCGGLGSNLAVNLVRMGADNLVLVDFDKIEPSNLNRQYYFADQVGQIKVEALKTNLKRISSKLKLKGHALKLDASNIYDIFKDCDVVAECFDGAANKAMLTERLLNKGMPVVSVSGLAGAESAEKITIQRPLKNLILVGDHESPEGCEGLLSYRVSVAAAHQAFAIMDFLVKGKKQ